jgi:hypothetical protein
MTDASSCEHYAFICCCWFSSKFVSRKWIIACQASCRNRASYASVTAKQAAIGDENMSLDGAMA